jgi:HK97 family phage major capsid protein
MIQVIADNITSLDNQRTALIAEMEAIPERALTAGRTITDNEQRTFDNLTDEVKAIDAQRADATARIEELRTLKARQEQSTRRAPIPASFGARTSEVRARAYDMLARTNVNLPTSWRDAAVDAIANDPTDNIARTAAVTADPHYLRAFFKLAGDPVRGHMDFSPAEHEAFTAVREYQRALKAQEARAMSVAGTGSVMVPFILDPALIITGAGSINPMRSVATVRQVAANNWHGVTAGQISASWDAEATAVSDDTPTLAQPTIPVRHGRAFIPVSFEAFDDIANLAQEVAMLFADAKDNLESTGFTTSNGSSNTPIGVSYAVGAVTASRVSPAVGGTLALADVYTLQEALPARHSARASWQGSIKAINKIRQLTMAVNSGNSVWTDMSAGEPAMLLGRSFRENSAMSASLTTGQDILLYGNLAKYLIADHVGGTTVELLPNLFDTTTGRPTSQRGWLMWWRVGADVTDVDALRQMRL